MSKHNELKALNDFDRLAIKLAKKYAKFYEYDDLYQIARIGIIEAVRTYNSEKGTKLLTHVFNTITFNIKKLLMKKTNFTLVTFDDDISEENLIYCMDDFTKDIENSQTINKILMNLTEKQKNIIFMKYIEGYTVNEIARILGCSHQNISYICKTAEKAINENIFDQGLTYEMLI